MDSSSSSLSWTKAEDKRFETALALYAENTEARWEKIARFMRGAKTVEEVKHHYMLLVVDVKNIDAGKIRMPKYKTPSATRNPGRKTKSGKLLEIYFT